MENHILKIEKFVNIISNDYNCGRFESVNEHKHLGYGYGRASGLFLGLGCGSDMGIEIGTIRGSCEGKGMAKGSDNKNARFQ